MKTFKISNKSVLSINHVTSFFYGDYNAGLCGVGIHLVIKQNHVFYLWMSSGRGSNTRSKLLTLWGLLWFVKKLGYIDLILFEDSKDIVDWENGFVSLHSLRMNH